MELMKIFTRDLPGKEEGALYGDNATAVAMAGGTAGVSWRSRRLKIRATALKELLDKEQWQLRHLKGAELVADGFTKGLTGVAWQKFCQDLGVRMEAREPDQGQDATSEKKKSNAGEGGKWGWWTIGWLWVPAAQCAGQIPTSSRSNGDVRGRSDVAAGEPMARIVSAEIDNYVINLGGESGWSCGESFRDKFNGMFFGKTGTRNPRGTKEEDSQGPTEPAESPPATNPSNNATGSGGDTGVASAAVAAAKRTRRNEEMADLGSATNVATYERDTGVIATPPEHVVTDAGRRRQSEERFGRGLRRRVRLETEEGENELSVHSDHHVEAAVKHEEPQPNEKSHDGRGPQGRNRSSSGK